MSNRRHSKHTPQRPNVQPLPEPAGSIVEAVTDRDRVYFERHPGALSYVRPYVPGELPGTCPPGTLVRVIQIMPGVRVRQVREPRPRWR